MNGTKVGYVGAVASATARPRWQMIFDNGNALPLHPDATAQVRKKNLLGETYIDLTRGTDAGQIQSGGVIPVSHTVPITEIDQVLAIFDPATVQRVQLLINALGEGTTNNGDSMNSRPAPQQPGHRAQRPGDGAVGAQAAGQRHRARAAEVLRRARQPARAGAPGVRHLDGGDAAARRPGAGDRRHGAAGRHAAAEPRRAGRRRGRQPALHAQRAARHADPAQQLPRPRAPASSPTSPSTARAIHDVFPNLGSSFFDTDPSNNNQHFWSVFSVTCTATAPATASQNARTRALRTRSRAAAMGG